MSEAIHTDGSMLRAIHRSTHGEVGRILMWFGPLGIISEIPKQIECFLWHRGARGSIVWRFYAALLGDEEDVVACSCRLKDILEWARQNRYINKAGSDKMLRTKFRLGLCSSLRDVSSHKFDNCKSFDDLRVDLRVIELECKLHKQTGDNTKKAQVKAQHTPKSNPEEEQDTTLSELKGLVCCLRERFGKLEKKVDEPYHRPSYSQEAGQDRLLRSLLVGIVAKYGWSITSSFLITVSLDFMVRSLDFICSSFSSINLHGSKSPGTWRHLQSISSAEPEAL